MRTPGFYRAAVLRILSKDFLLFEKFSDNFEMQKAYPFQEKKFLVNKTGKSYMHVNKGFMVWSIQNKLQYGSI